MRGATFAADISRDFSSFQPTPLMRGATWAWPAASSVWYAFQPAPLMRGATRDRLARDQRHHAFQPTPLIRGATDETPDTLGLLTFRATSRRFNPRPSCEGRRGRGRPPPRSGTRFNPRPSCEGRPVTVSPVISAITRFNPRPSSEGRPTRRRTRWATPRFQPTPLMRGATPWPPRTNPRPSFNPRPSCEGRPRCCAAGTPTTSSFNPRPSPSCEGRLQAHGRVAALGAVSTHAPHARGDRA